jgi:hypothetical protein
MAIKKQTRAVEFSRNDRSSGRSPNRPHLGQFPRLFPQRRNFRRSVSPNLPAVLVPAKSAVPRVRRQTVPNSLGGDPRDEITSPSECSCVESRGGYRVVRLERRARRSPSHDHVTIGSALGDVKSPVAPGTNALVIGPTALRQAVRSGLAPGRGTTGGGGGPRGRSVVRLWGSSCPCVRAVKHAVRQKDSGRRPAHRRGTPARGARTGARRGQPVTITPPTFRLPRRRTT